jgi:hypothetical protein
MRTTLLALALSLGAAATHRGPAAPQARVTAATHVEPGVTRCTSDGVCTTTDDAHATAPSPSVLVVP